MSPSSRPPLALPDAATLRRAVEIYLSGAYGGAAPEALAERVPPDGADPGEWLMGDLVERDPPDAPLERVRSFTLRLGNAGYPHMKLRLSRPPRDPVYLFTVDAHDAFLHADAGSADREALEALKRRNAEISTAVTAAWESAGLPTERMYLRGKIDEARERRTRGA